MPFRNAVARLALIPALALTLTACETLDGLFQGATDRERLPGERIPVIDLEQQLDADPALAATPVVLPKPYRNAEWPQPGGSSFNAMYHLEASGPLALAWRAEAGEGASQTTRVTASPVVGGGRVYTMDAFGAVGAFDAASGAPVWRVTLVPEEVDPEKGIGGGVAFDNGRLFVSSGFGFVAAFDAATGAEVWRHTTQLPVRSAPTVADGRVYAITQENKLLVLGVADGKVLWDHAGIGEVAGVLSSTSVAAQGEVAIVPYTSGEIYAIRVQNGRVAWSDTLSSSARQVSLAVLSDIAGRPVIDRNLVFAVSSAGTTAAIDLRSGARAWTRNFGGVNTPWAAGDYLYVLTADAKLICLLRADGRVRWIAQLPRFLDEEDKSGPQNWSGPMLVSDRLLAVSSEGQVASVSPYTGEILGQITLPAGAEIAPVVADGTVYILTNEAELIALR